MPRIHWAIFAYLEERECHTLHRIELEYSEKSTERPNDSRTDPQFSWEIRRYREWSLGMNCGKEESSLVYLKAALNQESWCKKNRNNTGEILSPWPIQLLQIVSHVPMPAFRPIFFSFEPRGWWHKLTLLLCWSCYYCYKIVSNGREETRCETSRFHPWSFLFTRKSSQLSKGSLRISHGCQESPNWSLFQCSSYLTILSILLLSDESVRTICCTWVRRSQTN